jgi:hypothetical protein
MTTAPDKPKDSAVRCVRDVRDLPLEAYRLPNDGRKWKSLCKERQRLAMLLATYADPDGTNIKVGTDKLAGRLGWAPNTLFDRLDDLTELGLHIKPGGYSEYGTRLRLIDADWLEFARFIFGRWEKEGKPRPAPEIGMATIVRPVKT